MTKWTHTYKLDHPAPGWLDAILSRIDMSDPEGCWIWTGRIKKEYGDYVGTTAHRALYWRLVEPVPAGLQVDHLCANTLCVNPDHLEPVTGLENMRRRVAATTHCKHGHPFDEENTRLLKDGRRVCRACVRDVQARARARRKAAGR